MKFVNLIISRKIVTKAFILNGHVTNRVLCFWELHWSFLNHTSLDHPPPRRCLKYSLILPIPMKSNASVLSDYRHISIPPTLSKGLEKIVYKQTTTFLPLPNFLNLFNLLLSVYRSIHSASIALLKFTNEIKRSKDKGIIIILTLINKNRVFNSLHIYSLLTKLSPYNFTLITVQSFSSVWKTANCVLLSKTFIPLGLTHHQDCHKAP